MPEHLAAIEPTAFDHAVAEHYSPTPQTSPVVVACVDVDLRYAWIYNPHPDCAPWAAIARRDDQPASAEGVTALVAMQRRVLAEGVQLRQARSFDFADGSYTYDIAITPATDESGQVTHMFVVFVDITQQVKAEQALRAERDTLIRVLDSLPVGVWLAAPDGTLVGKNKESDRIWHGDNPLTASVADNVAYAAWDAGTGRRLAPEDYPVAQSLRTGEPVAPTELQIRRFDGSEGTILVSSAPIRDVQGTLIGVMGINVDITARKEEEQALSESEARYRSLFENNHSVMLLIDRETGAIFDANSAAGAFYGWSRDQLRSMNIADINTTPVAELIAEIQRPPEEQRYPYYFQHRLADGSIRDVVVFRGPLPLAGRSLLYSITHDITEGKQAEDALRRSEAALKRSQEVAHVGHWTWDTRSNIVSWSDEMKRIFGQDPQTFAGDLNQLIDLAIHPDDAAGVRAMNAAVIEGQRPAATEYRVVWHDGSVHHVRAIPADITRDEHGNIAQLWGVVQDITDRKLRDLEREQLLQQLQEKAEQLAQVMRSVPEGVLLLDSPGRVVLANPQAERMLVLLAEYDQSQQLRQLGSAAVETLLTSPPLGEWHTVRSGQQVFEVIPRPLESGPILAGWVLVLREVTAERALQEQLQRQERLAAVGQLAAGIAHDFNNIMSVISIYAELTSEAPGLTAKERSRTLTIIEQTQRAARMIRQILDFSRQSVLERQALDLLPLLKEQVKLLTQTLPENVEMDLDTAPGEYCVLADPTRMQQLVMNLAVNARDAMPQGGQLRLGLRRLTVVSAKHAPVPGMNMGEWIFFEIQDTGAGISPEHLPHIFEPFFTTKAPGKGTGLGLAQAYGIVAQHNGHITVSSEFGTGTTFTIYLPALLLVAAPSAGAPGLLEATPHGHGELVLVVEDDATLRASLVSLLEDLHYRVAQAANGEEALAYLAAASVDLILSDVVMPRLGGIAMLKMLRQRELRTPMILMSGHPMGEERAGLEEYGLSAWLDKPPSRQVLTQAIAEALAASTGGPAAG